MKSLKCVQLLKDLEFDVKELWKDLRSSMDGCISRTMSIRKGNTVPHVDLRQVMEHTKDKASEMQHSHMNSWEQFALSQIVIASTQVMSCVKGEEYSPEVLNLAKDVFHQIAQFMHISRYRIQLLVRANLNRFADANPEDQHIGFLLACSNNEVTDVMDSLGNLVVAVKYSTLSSWSVSDVMNWMKSLVLTTDYATLVKSNGIDGDVLSMMSADDFKDIGVTALGDLKKIKRALSTLH